jgi:hypothetical protein
VVASSDTSSQGRASIPLPTIEYLVGPDSTVLEIHGPWDDFARDNAATGLSAGSVLGRRLDDFVAGPEVRLIYQALLGRIRQTGKPARFTFRCDGPTCRRFMEMRLDLAAPDVVRFRSRVLREEPRDAQPLLDVRTKRSEVLLTVCSWCKRFKTESDDWVEVEEYVERTKLMEADILPRISHGMCPSCETDLGPSFAPAA